MELERTLESVMDRLTETEVIKLSDDPVPLPYYLTLPAERLDIELAKQLMADDGFSKTSQ